MAPFADESRWQYQCPFRRVWVDVSAEEDKKLKEGYLKSKEEPVVTYMMNGVRFKTEFPSMLRINVASKRSMEVRLRGGELPFGPPRPDRSGGPEPSAASMGQEKPGVRECVVPVELEDGPQGPVPHQVRKAWGQGLIEGVTMAGEFQFTLELSDKDHLGEMLTWHMLAAGVGPQSLDSKALKFTSKKGQVAANSKEEVTRMLDNANNFPVTVSYQPPRVFKGMSAGHMVGCETERILLRFVKDAVAAVGADIGNVRHAYQKRTFERYLLYLEDHYYQNDDRLDRVTPLPEFLRQYPHMIFNFNLTDKTGPNLHRVLRGEVDILEYLFGG